MPWTRKQLQQAAFDTSCDEVALLRQTRMLAQHVRDGEQEQWAVVEQEGYAEGALPPGYRTLHAGVMVRHSSFGVRPVRIPSYADSAHSVVLRQRLPTLLELARSTQTLTAPFGATRHEDLTNMFFDMPIGAKFYRVFEPVDVYGVVAAIRHRVVRWTLRSDVAWPAPLPHSFAAPPAVSWFLANFYGPTRSHRRMVASPRAPQIVQGALDVVALVGLCDCLVEQLPGLSLGDTQLRELRADLTALRSQAESPRPKEAVIQLLLLSIRAVLEQVANGVVAQGLLQRLAPFLR